MHCVDCPWEGKRKAGGLGNLWGEDMESELLSFSQNHVDVKLNDIFANKLWRFTGFYGHLEENKKISLVEPYGFVENPKRLALVMCW